MSLKVVKVLQFSVSFRNVFGLCPFSLRTDQKVARNQSEVTIESVYLPILGLIITLVVYSLAIYNIIILHVRDGVPFLNEDVFGNDLTTPSSVSFIVLGIAGTMNFLSYILVVLVTFFNRHSWLRIFQETMVIFDKLDKDYSVHCDTLRLRLITNGILAVSIIFHCCFAYYFAPVISFSSVSFTLPVVYLVLTMCTTLSTFDLISTIALLTEIFELHLGIPRHKYNTEMFLTFFESLDLLEDVGNSHGLRECFNSTNQVFGILSHLFIAVYHIQQYGTVNMLFLFGIISAIPRVINLFSIAFFGSLLTTSIRNTARRIESELRDDYGKAAAFSMHMVLYKDSMAITAHNFFSMNMAMLYGVIGSTCTYFMVLVQFKADEDNTLPHQNDTDIVL